MPFECPQHSGDGRRRGLILGAVLLSAATLLGCGRAEVRELALPGDSVAAFSAPADFRAVEFEYPEQLIAGSSAGVWTARRGLGLEPFADFTSGLPAQRIFSLESGPESTLWAGSSRGAVEIVSGEVRHIFDRAGGLAGDFALAMARRGDGSLFVGTERGISIIKDSSCCGFFYDSHSPALQATLAASRYSDRGIFFGKMGYLSEMGEDGFPHVLTFWRDNRIKKLVSYEITAVKALAADRFVVGTKHGLTCIDGDQWTHVPWYQTGSGEGQLRYPWVQSIEMLPSGEIWVAHGFQGAGDQQYGIARSMDCRRWSYLTQADGLPPGAVLSVRRAPWGEIILGMSEGIARWDGEAFSPIPMPQGLADNHVVALAHDAFQTTYVLTATSLAVFRNGRFADSYHLPAKDLTGLALLPHHGVVALSFSGIVYRQLENERWRKIFSRPGERVLAVREELKTGTLRVITSAGEYQQTVSQEKGFELGTRWSLLPHERVVKGQFAGDREVLLVGETNPEVDPAGSCLRTVRKGRLTDVSLPGRVRNFCHRLQVAVGAGDEKVLVGPFGVYLGTLKGWTRIPTPFRPDEATYALAVGSRDLLIGTRRSGVFRFTKDHWTKLSLEQRSFPGFVTALAYQPGVGIWVGTAEEGLFLIRYDLELDG